MQTSPNLTKEQLRLSTELFRNLVSNPDHFEAFLLSFPGVVYRSNASELNKKVLFINDAIETLSGYPADLFRSGDISIADIIVQSELQAFSDSYKDSLQMGDDFTYHYTIKHRQGRNVRVLSHFHTYRDKEGKPDFIDATMIDITESNEVEKELNRIISINHNLLDSTPNIVYTKNRDGIYKLVNRAMVEVTGIPENKLIGFSDDTLVSDPELRSKYKEQDELVFTTGENYQSEPFELELHGERRWFKTVKSALRSEEGEIEGLLGIVSDITQEMRAEKKIAESQRILDIVYNTSRDVITVLKPIQDRFEYVSCNEAYLKLLKAFDVHVSEEDLVGVDVIKHGIKHHVFSEEKANEVYSNLKKVAREKEDYSYTEITPIEGSDSKVYIDAQLMPILNSEGDIKYIVYRGHDFTDLINYSRQLQEREELLNSITRNVQDAIFRSQVEDRLIYANDAMSRMFGYSRKEISKLSPERLFASQFDRKQLIDELLEKGSIADREILFIKKDGSTFWGLLSGSMSVEKGNQQVIDGIIVDHTEQRRVRETLRETNNSLENINQELDKLIYRTSHDIRSPLASLISLTELMKLESENPEIQSYVEMMEKQLLRLDNLILDIINVRRIAKSGPEYSYVDIRSIAQDVFESVKFLDHAEQIKKDVIIEAEVKFVQDPNDIKIILENLLSNAVKYSKGPGSDSYIRLFAAIDRKFCRLIVEDNGIGIGKDQLEKVFDMFTRATNKNVGTGLGLFIVQEAVKKLGGEIRVDSEENKWTRFSVTIPNMLEVRSVPADQS